MTGWNLPPGVNVSDLPGNSPAELAWEEFDEWAMKELSALSLEEAQLAVRIGKLAALAAREHAEGVVRDVRAGAFQEGIDYEQDRRRDD